MADTEAKAMDLRSEIEDNAWVAAVADGLEKAMDADGDLRLTYAIVWRFAMGRCPEDKARFENWLLGWLRKDYAAELEGRPHATMSILTALALSTNPEVYALTRDMTLDTRLTRATRELAANIARPAPMVAGSREPACPVQAWLTLDDSSP